MHSMASLVRTKPLSVCITRGAELIHDLNDIPQFQSLRQQIKALLSSLLSMMRAVHPNELDTSQSDPTYSPGLSLLAAYLHELGRTCDYYGAGAKAEWKLSDEDRAFILNEIDNPFDRLSQKLCCLAKALQVILDDEQMDYETKIQKFCEWTESTFTHWNFFQAEFEAARILSAATSSASEDHLTTGSPTTADDSVDLSNGEIPQLPEPKTASAWDKIGEQLAEEGIQDDAIERIANDLKACARNLVRGERPRVGPDEHQLAEPTSNKNATPAINKPEPSSGASAKPPTKKTMTSANVKPKTASAPSHGWFDHNFVSSKATAALVKITTNYEVFLPELLVVAFKQETENDSRNYRQVLDLIYTMACHDTGRPRLHARVASSLQAKTPAQIRNIMTSKEAATVVSGEGPVTGYLFKKCSEDWDHGKHGNKKISVEDFTLGLSRFIGELARYEVFNAEHIHCLIRLQWGTTLKRNQFMAVYKVLKTAGRMLDSKADTSDMEDHFKRISSLRDKKKTPEIVKELAQELSSLRSSGWKKQTKVMDQVEQAIRKKT
ncbi:hypothetical protein SLS63_013175 [Diaporthe eres]|uniref:Uncharacterized protein n=1 Tax=Diaporthe eres TaxID=83184 RepID=A0ABR1NP89_DIAER